MQWWMWAVAGLVFLVVELLTPGSFVFIFFAVGGMCVGALVGLDFLPEFWQQSAAMGLFSTVSLIIFRRRLLHFATPPQSVNVDSLVGETAIITEAIAVGATGKAELRGTSWMAHNAGSVILEKGQRCRIERVEGITLWLRDA